MDIGRIAVRALVAYIYLLITTRASGKRVVNQATPIDFMVSLIIGDLIDDAIWAEVSVAKFAVAAGAIVAIDVLVNIGTYHSASLLRLVNGAPRTLLRDGYADGHALRREQMNEGDLAHLLRQQGIEKWSDVHMAVLERSSELSVIRRPGAEPAQKQDEEHVPR